MWTVAKSERTGRYSIIEFAGSQKLNRSRGDDMKESATVFSAQP